MDFRELAFGRRSVRKFEDRRVDTHLIHQLLDIVFTAPSSKNSRTTRITVTEDKGVLEAISKMRSRGSSFVKDAPLAFIIMGDDSQTDLWRENCAISATVLQFAAESLGLGSCWVHVNGRPHNEDEPQGMTAEDYLREHFPCLPPFPIMCAVAVGYPAEKPKPHTIVDNSDKVFFI